MPDIYTAKEAFAFTGKNGVPRTFAPGSPISSDDPDFKGKEHLFQKVEVAVADESARRTGRAMEDASAEPNAKRSVSTTERKTSSPGPATVK